MFKKPHCPVIAIEEHYWDEELAKTYTGVEAGRPGRAVQAAARFRHRPHQGNGRGRHRHSGDLARRAVGAETAGRDRGGVGPPRQRPAARRRRRQSDAFCRLRRLADGGPGSGRRRARTLVKLGFKGAMLHGLAHGTFLDDKRFWPIYARAEALDVPIYLHPSLPNAAVMRSLLCGLRQGLSDGGAAGLGLHGRDRHARDPHGAVRRVRAHPRLKIILGHLGETLPFLVWRIDQALARPGQKSLSFRDIFCSNFYITTSGNFSNPALLCCVMEMGIDRILFAVDWPFVENPPATQWMDRRAAVRRGQGEDSRRQCQAAAAHVGNPSARADRVASSRHIGRFTPSEPIMIDFAQDFWVRSAKPQSPIVVCLRTPLSTYLDHLTAAKRA